MGAHRIVHTTSGHPSATPRRVLALLALPASLLGCVSPTAPPPPPGGGQALVLSESEFSAQVEPVLVRKGCDATGDCHGGGIRGTFELSPPGAKDAHFDFAQASLQVTATDRDASPLLTNPLDLAAGGSPHPFKPFTSTADTDYVAIRQWIQDGVLR